MEFRLNGTPYHRLNHKNQNEEPKIEGAAVEPVVNEPAPFSFDVLKEKYGYEKTRRCFK